MHLTKGIPRLAPLRLIAIVPSLVRSAFANLGTDGFAERIR